MTKRPKKEERKCAIKDKIAPYVYLSIRKESVDEYTKMYKDRHGEDAEPPLGCIENFLAARDDIIQKKTNETIDEWLQELERKNGVYFLKKFGPTAFLMIPILYTTVRMSVLSWQAVMLKQTNIHENISFNDIVLCGVACLCIIIFILTAIIQESQN